MNLIRRNVQRLGTRLILLLATALSACRHVPAPASTPEKRPTEGEIRAHIPGTWISEADPRWNGWRTITFGSDGTFVVGLTNGTNEVLGTWRVVDQSLWVTWTKTNYITNLESGERYALQPGGGEVWPVIYVDEHRLVYRPGISFAGVERFRR